MFKHRPLFLRDLAIKGSRKDDGSWREAESLGADRYHVDVCSFFSVGGTGHTHSLDPCSDTPRYSGSAGHSPPGADPAYREHPPGEEMSYYEEVEITQVAGV